MLSFNRIVKPKWAPPKALTPEFINDICEFLRKQIASTDFRSVARSFLKTGTMHVIISEAIRQSLIEGIVPDDDDCDDW